MISIYDNENIQDLLVNNTCDAILAESPMEPLTLLDGGEVKADKCPACHTSFHLERDKGFKICPSCNSIYKVWNNVAYKIIVNSNIENLTVNEMILRNMGINSSYK